MYKVSFKSACKQKRYPKTPKTLTPNYFGVYNAILLNFVALIGINYDTPFHEVSSKLELMGGLTPKLAPEIYQLIGWH